MSMYIEFEPHSWYMGFAIKDDRDIARHNGGMEYAWYACTDNGNTYRIDELEAGTLAELRRMIRGYHIKQRNGYAERMEKRAAK